MADQEGVAFQLPVPHLRKLLLRDLPQGAVPVAQLFAVVSLLVVLEPAPRFRT